jgi:peroxiredoxin
VSDTHTSERQRSPAITGATRWLLLAGGLFLLGGAVALLLFGTGLLWQSDREAGAGEVSVQPLDVATPRSLEAPMTVGGAPQAGEPAPPFLLTDLQGKEIGLAQYRGQPVMLNFWATWCAPCIVEMPELQAAYAAHGEDGLVILGLNRDEEQAIVSDFLANDLTISIDFPILLDEHAAVADSYGVLNMPTTYFIDREGNVSAVHRGPLTQKQIEAYLADLS